MDELKSKNNVLILGVVAIVGIVAISLGYFSFASGFKEKNLVGGASYGLATDSDLAGEASQLPSQVAVNRKCAVLKTQIDNYAKILDTYTKQYNSQCISICTDSDGGKIYDVKGATSGPNGVATDICNTDVSNSFLLEYFCGSDGMVSKEGVNCPNGCKDGHCLDLTSSCRDLDKGIDYYKEGDLQIYGKDGIYYSVPETCIDNMTVNELYCNYWPSKNLTFTCPNGCKDGACLPK